MTTCEYSWQKRPRRVWRQSPQATRGGCCRRQWRQRPAVERRGGTLHSSIIVRPPSSAAGHAAEARGGMRSWHMPPHAMEAGPRAGIRPGRPTHGALILMLKAGLRGGWPHLHWFVLKWTKETTLILRRCGDKLRWFSCDFVTLLIVTIPARGSLQRFYQWMHSSV
jgi:hypothetical protein